MFELVRRTHLNRSMFRRSSSALKRTSRRCVASTADNDPLDGPSNGSEDESHRTQITFGMCIMPSMCFVTLPDLVLVFLWTHDGRCVLHTVPTVNA